MLPLEEACFRLGAEVLLAVQLQLQRQLNLAIQGLSREQLRLAIALECFLTIKSTLLGEILENLTALFVGELLVCNSLGRQGLTQKRPQQSVVSKEAKGFGLEGQGSIVRFAARDINHEQRRDCNAADWSSSHPAQDRGSKTPTSDDGRMRRTAHFFCCQQHMGKCARAT
ncbi:MAG: hypothetical protein QM522_10845 [Chitinophagaceae bacterium]|nr:hypothetical protein [Chitinophagaceae bacterium]